MEEKKILTQEEFEGLIHEYLNPQTEERFYEVSAEWRGAYAALLSLVQKQREALEKIASFPEGPEVTGSFDEPASAKIAREALALYPTERKPTA